MRRGGGDIAESISHQCYTCCVGHRLPWFNHALVTAVGTTEDLLVTRYRGWLATAPAQPVGAARISSSIPGRRLTEMR